MTQENNEMIKQEDVSTFVGRLQQASDELNRIKESFSQGMEEINRIQSMLSSEGVEKISTMVSEYQNRIMESERKREEAHAGAQKYNDELEKEKERLMKLWDAYKNQEEELSVTEKKTMEYEEKIQNAESAKQQLEADLTARISTLQLKIDEQESQMKEVEQYRQQISQFEITRNQMESEINNIKQDIQTKDETIARLNKEVDCLKEYEKYAGYQDKFNEVTREYEKEKERLTKLFHLYEETETECKTLREEVASWEQWYDSNSEIFNSFEKLMKSAGRLRREPQTQTEPVKQTKKKKKTKSKK